MLLEPERTYRLARIVALAGALALLLLAYDARPAGPPADAVTVRSLTPSERGAAATAAAGSAATAAGASEPSEAPPPLSASSAPHVELATREISAAAPGLDPAPWGIAPPLRPSAPATPRINALGAVVLDEASGGVLFEADPHRQLAPASLTKIATAIVALRHGGLDEEVVSDVDGFAMRGSTTMGLHAGDRLTRRDLLYGLMLPSGNDAALVLGRSIAGTDDEFVWRMNALARELGLRDTFFSTPHGLGRAGYSSAYDLALLARHAMQSPEFAAMVQTTSWNVSGSRTYAVHNVNSFLFNYDGADGVKTGFTNSAGRTLVASATRDGHRLYAVLLNDPTMYSDATALLDWAFATHGWTAAAVAAEGGASPQASGTGAP